MMPLFYISMASSVITYDEVTYLPSWSHFSLLSLTTGFQPPCLSKLFSSSRLSKTGSLSPDYPPSRSTPPLKLHMDDFLLILPASEVNVSSEKLIFCPLLSITLALISSFIHSQPTTIYLLIVCLPNSNCHEIMSALLTTLPWAHTTVPGTWQVLISTVWINESYPVCISITVKLYLLSL